MQEYSSYVEIKHWPRVQLQQILSGLKNFSVKSFERFFHNFVKYVLSNESITSPHFRHMTGNDLKIFRMSIISQIFLVVLSRSIALALYLAHLTETCQILKCK